VYNLTERTARIGGTVSNCRFAKTKGVSAAGRHGARDRQSAVPDVLAHYGVVALLCRARNPDRKGKVEAGVAHAQKTPLKGLRFEKLEQAQAYLDRWEARWADTRIHDTTKRQVAVMFAEEKPNLGELPLERFFP